MTTDTDTDTDTDADINTDSDQQTSKTDPGHAAKKSAVSKKSEGGKDKGGDEEKGSKDKGAGKDKDGDEDGKDGKDGKKEEQKPKSRTPIIILGIVGVVAVIGALIYWLMTRNQQGTDDAYTEGNAVSIAPKISGYVVEDRIDDNMVVHKGDLLLRIDPRDYQVSFDQSRANLDTAQAQLLSAQVDLKTTRVRAPANLQQARAQLEQARANYAQAERDFKRQRSVDPRATTQTSVDQSTSAMAGADANVKSAKAQVSVASLVKETIETSEAALAARQAQLEQAQASLEQAEVNLSYTEIRAPQDGMITRRNVDLGTFAQAGQQVFYLVTPSVWVVANYKETQMTRIRVGQRVAIKVDAYPELNLSGHVESIQSGAGARFTTFPAENATGNFVKIVRRVPVKIVIDHGLEQWPFLPLGLSVDPTVYFK